MNTIRTGRQEVGKLCALALVLFLAACSGSGGGSTLTANAGVDQVVDDGATVSLNGAASVGASSFSWVQTTGPKVVLSNASFQRPTFTAPAVSGGTTLAFRLTVGDGSSSATDSVTVTVNDVTTPTASVSPETLLGIRDSVVITFDEPMDPATLVITGIFAGVSDGGSWSENNSVLTIAPDEHGAWESGSQSLSLTVDDVAGNSSSVDASFDILLDFTTFQAASVVIGQPDFASGAANQGGAIDANTLREPWGKVAFDDENDILFVPDSSNNRVLAYAGIPDANDADAAFVLGQADFSTDTAATSATQFNYPIRLEVQGGKLFVTDYSNNRIAIFNSVPQSGPATIDVVVGQADKISNAVACSQDSIERPEGISVTPDGKLIVGDLFHHRVLIWNSIPTSDGEPADLVLGQQNFINCAANDQDGDGGTDGPEANTLNFPAAVWSDGERLVVADQANSRVLVWGTFPTTNGQAADIVLGQADFTTTTDLDVTGQSEADAARTISRPYGGLWSNGEQLFVSMDTDNRVMVWNTFPNANNAPADVVLGQVAFDKSGYNDQDGNGTDDGPSANVVGTPGGVYAIRDKLFVTDAWGNSRVMIFESN